jgi:lipoprotein-anchoring transpeptidase ErfK/SrfK
MNGRTLLLAGLGLAASAAGASGQTRLFNFNAAPFFGEASRYRGRRVVDFPTRESPGTIIIRTDQRKLYYVLPGGQAIRYGVGVGRAGFQWGGIARIGHKAVWPQWRPPQEMIERELAQYGRELPQVMAGGPQNPLGARALYLYQGKRDTLYRIHGTNAPDTIGQAMSSGCIRMLNDEVVELYEQVSEGTKVIVV